MRKPAVIISSISVHDPEGEFREVSLDVIHSRSLLQRARSRGQLCAYNPKFSVILPKKEAELLELGKFYALSFDKVSQDEAQEIHDEAKRDEEELLQFQRNGIIGAV